MSKVKKAPVDWEALLAGLSRGKTVAEYSADRRIFDQGQPADCIFYLRKGKVKLSVISQHGKEAIVATLSAGNFLGEGCLAGQPLRMSTATTVTDCSLFRIEKLLMLRMLHERHEISELFVAHLLSRNIDTKRISWTSFLILAKSVSRGSSCCSLILARRPEPNLCFRKSVRITWPK
jgi:CRP/FNR family cyclic AMP-dependent transcriptional regulator